METFLYYLLRASVLMALFYGFYKLFFGKNTFHNFNRFSLMSVVMLIAVLPVFRFNLIPEKKVEPVIIENLPMDFSNIPIVEISELPAPRIEIPWIELLSVIFILGFLFALARYLIGLNQLIGIIRKSEKQTLADNTVLCVAEKDISPFSWMKYIVLSRKDVSADNRAIINHERAHIHLQHSFDMIFFDLFTCVFWFNPFSWLLRREIQSIHEYQADEQVLNNGIDAKQYQLLLIRKSVGEHKFALANNFRQRDLHKRITMMMKNKTNKRMKWNYTIALPVLFLAMVALSVPKLNAKVPINSVDTTDNLQKKESDNIVVTSDSLVYEGGETAGSKLIDLISDRNDRLKMKLGSNPLVIYDGKEISLTELSKLTTILNYKILWSKNAIEEYGEKGKDGAIVILSEQNNDKKLTVSGLVVSKGEFIPGVAVVIKGSFVGTVTDTQGKFVIKADKGDVLRFLMVGYNAFEYEVEKAQDNLVIVLQQDEVVAIGAGTMESLHGKVQGVEIRGNGDTEVIGIRTQDGKQPLYVIDGIRVKDESELKKINKDNIESVNVLKGAGSVYGDDAKNGVIIITTKKGTQSDNKLKEVSPEKLIVIDGKKTGKGFRANEFDPNQIESITILKDAAATSIYGDDGKDGVVLIATKNPQQATTQENFDEKKALYIIDGEKLTKDFELNSISPNEIESISVLKGKAASEIYGDEGKNGVISITTKKTNQNRVNLNEMIEKDKPLIVIDGIKMPKDFDLNPKEADDIKSIDVLKGETGVAMYGEDGKNGVIMITTKKPAQNRINLNEMIEKDKPLIIIDGIKMSKDFELNSVKPDEIESISILKNKSAIEIYGEEGKNGVIMITKKTNEK